MPHRREVLVAGALAALALPLKAAAHHGWAWAEDEEFTLSGVIRGVRLGNPHGELDVEAADGVWVCEIGQPYRNEAAGLTEDLLSVGTDVTLEGHRSRDREEKVMKAERVIIAGLMYNLYPDRD